MTHANWTPIADDRLCSCLQLISLLPHHGGGLTPIALGLFHPSATVRNAVVDLIDRMQQYPVSAGPELGPGRRRESLSCFVIPDRRDFPGEAQSVPTHRVSEAGGRAR
jgi:hypothetical protein